MVPEAVSRHVVGQELDSLEALFLEEILEQADQHSAASATLVLACNVDFLELYAHVLVWGNDHVAGDLAVFLSEIDPLAPSVLGILLVGTDDQVDTRDFFLLGKLRIAEVPVQDVKSVVVFARHISLPKVHNVTSQNKICTYKLYHNLHNFANYTTP